MYQHKTKAGAALVLIIMASLLAACGAPAAQPTSTMDPNLIYTAAAQTVQAQFTQAALLTPSPTATEAATATLAVPTIDTSLPTLPGPGSATQASTSAVAPIVTLTPMGAVQPTSAAAPSRITAQWVKNDPPDGTIVLAGTKFDIAWTIKNTGTTTWNTNYTYGYLSGDKYFEKLTYNFRKEVKPGEEVTILVDAVAPSKSGSYYTWWKIKDDQGTNIGDVDLTITVVQPNETPKVTATTAP